MAQSVPELAAPNVMPLPASGTVTLGFVAEFERLAGRPPSDAERDVSLRACAQRESYVQGLVPEALAHIALALAVAQAKTVLFVSPWADLLELRQLRLGYRGPAAPLMKLVQKRPGESPRKPSGQVAWSTPNELDVTLLSRAFGAQGPDMIFVEGANAALSTSFHYRPSLKRLRDVFTRFPRARVVVSLPARAKDLAPGLRAAWGLSQAIDNGQPSVDPKSITIRERAFTGPTSPMLRVTTEESDAIAAVVGPLPRPCVVLCSTPAQADQVYAHLQAEQVPVHRYHSALPDSDRARELLHFALPGRRAVLVAVSSFGPQAGFAGQGSFAPGSSRSMPEDFGHGYARRDIRSIVHLCAPCSLDQYAEELALLRLGAEEHLPTTALMLYSPAHLALNSALLERKRPDSATLSLVIEALLAAPRHQFVETEKLDRHRNVSQRSISCVLDFLTDLRVVQRSDLGVRTLVGKAQLEAAARDLEGAFADLRRGDEVRLSEVEAYAKSARCRVAVLTESLSWDAADAISSPLKNETRCGRCDICDPEGITSKSDATRGNRFSSPTIESRPGKRRSPVRRYEDDDDFDTEEDAFIRSDTVEA